MLTLLNMRRLLVLTSLFLSLAFSAPIMAVEQICPGGASPDPNVVFCEDFENWNNHGWDVGYNGGKAPASNFVRSDKKVHGNYGAWTGQQIFDGYWGTFGYDALKSCWDGTGLSELYIRWYTYVSPTYVWGSSEDKLFLLYDCKYSIVAYVAANRNDYMCPTCGNWGLAKPALCNYQDCDYESGSPCNDGNNTYVNRGQNQGNDITLQVGHTYLFEWYIKLNTPGQCNGLLKLWIDDVTGGDPQRQTLRMSYSNMRYLRTGDSGKKFGYQRLTVYSQRKYADEPTDRYMTWDDIVISKARIGPRNGSPIHGPPAPPTGLKIVN